MFKYIFFSPFTNYFSKWLLLKKNIKSSVIYFILVFLKFCISTTHAVLSNTKAELAQNIKLHDKTHVIVFMGMLGIDKVLSFDLYSVVHDKLHKNVCMVGNGNFFYMFKH